MAQITCSRRGLLTTGAATGLSASLFGAGAPATAAPRLGPAEPQWYRFELGDFEVTTLSDAFAVIDGPWPIVGEDVDRARLKP